jgi:hypothetical protein
MAASSDPNNVSTVSSDGQLAIRWFQSAAIGGRPLKKANALIARATPGRVHRTLRRAGGKDCSGSGTSILGRPQRRQVSASKSGRSHPQSLPHAVCELIAHTTPHRGTCLNNGSRSHERPPRSPRE